ncbi:MAG: hypothetical protein K0R19_2937 [Bacillota bacterium]|nr:hypothetical protein [Bacillota bacterium]
MKPLFRSFSMFILQIARDRMLYAVCISPVLAGLFFRFGIPYIETLLCSTFQETSILKEYYLLFDLFLCTLTPFLFCFSASMVVLTEHDENMTRYLAVTPVGKKGYLISRFLFPAAISFIVSMLLLQVFSLTVWHASMMLIVCLLGSLLCVATSLLVVGLSRNRVEGMAVTKLSGMVLMGLIVPFFVISKVQYLFFFLPSFWLAKLSRDGNYFLLVPSAAASLIWIFLLYRRSEKKLA